MTTNQMIIIMKNLDWKNHICLISSQYCCTAPRNTSQTKDIFFFARNIIYEIHGTYIRW